MRKTTCGTENAIRIDAAEPPVALSPHGEPFTRGMQDIVDYAILVLDAQGRIASCNAGAMRLFGFDEGEMRGRHYSMLFSPEDVELGLPGRELETARVEGRAENDRWHVRKDGGRFWGSGVTTPLPDDAEGRFISFLRDMTIQKLAQDALQESEERYRKLAEQLEEMSRGRERFLAILGHELRNPLAPILAALQVMRNDRAETTRQQQARHVIERQVRQLAHLVDDLLDTSRLAAGKLQLRKEPTELRVVVERAVESARPMIESHHHQLSVALPGEPIWLHADPSRLEQVFLNLFNNAAKYTPDGGRIGLVAERRHGEAVIRVEDNGRGVSAEMRSGIFEMFSQAERTLNPSHDGLGVGLTLVKNLVEMHGGSVAVESEGLGRGSQFIVQLPIAMSTVPTEGPQPPIAETSAGAGGLRVVVADDNRDSVKMLSLILKGMGHHVFSAYDGLEALEVSAAFPPDVLLLDIGMPNLDGYETARRIRQKDWAASTVLIALSGWGQEDDKRRAKEAGFDHHLVKPVEMAHLQKLLDSVPRTRG